MIDVMLDSLMQVTLFWALAALAVILVSGDTCAAAAAVIAISFLIHSLDRTGRLRGKRAEGWT